MSGLKLQLDSFTRRTLSTFDIEQAVDYLVDDNSGYHDGAVEAANRKAGKAAEYLAKLMTKLHAKGLLTDDEVVEILDERFKVAQ